MKILSAIVDVFLITLLIATLHYGGITIADNLVVLLIVCAITVFLSLKSYVEGINAGIRMFR